jgi:hypothetical protein
MTRQFCCIAKNAYLSMHCQDYQLPSFKKEKIISFQEMTDFLGKMTILLCKSNNCHKKCDCTAK